MKKQELSEKNITDSPGVYVFKNKEKSLYVGKATSLRDRVKSYFNKDLMDARGARVVKMVDEAGDIEWTETDSVLEALILEANLIKKLKPPYNVREKDNKSFNWVVITDEEYPRVLSVRGRELQITWDPDDIKYSFGPYPHSGELKEALKIVRKIFPFRGRKDSVKKKRQRSTLNEQIGLTPPFSTGEVSQKDYMKRIRHIKLFFEGKKKSILKELERDMKKAVKKEDFEKAQELKKRIFALEHIRDVSLIKPEKHDLSSTEQRIEGYDVAHIAGTAAAGVMVVLEDGIPDKTNYRKFKIRSNKKGSDTDALREVLERRLEHSEWPLPKLFVIDGGVGQRNTAVKVLREAGVEIPVVSVVKDERHRPREILGDKKIVKKYEKDILIANAEAHRFAQNYHTYLRKKRSGM